MQNIYITKYKQTTIDLASVVTVCFNELDNTFYITDKENNIHQLSYDPSSQSVNLSETIPADPELMGSNIIQITYLIDSQSLCVVTAEGSIFKVTSKQTQLVAQNEDGIFTASWSPSQDRLVVITKNNTLLQLNQQFNLDNELPLNDSIEQGSGYNSKISWKPDGKFCVINFGIKGSQARKCLMRDNLLNVFKSAAKPDPDPKGLVQSVSETPVNGLLSQVAWNPTGNIIAGADKIQGKIRVIFWEKNGLRHLEFNLQSWVKEVKELTYSHDGQILYVEVITEDLSRELLLYHRANYHWYLKTSLHLDQQDHYILFKERKNNLFIIGKNRFQFFQFSIKANNWEWKSYENQIDDPSCMFYSVDNNRLLVSDYSKSIIPPPMCLKQLKTKDRILASSKLGNYVLLVTLSSIYLYNHSEYDLQEISQNTIKERWSNLKLLQISPLRFTVNGKAYSVKQKKVDIQQAQFEQSLKSKIKLEDYAEGQIQFEQINNQLFINDSLLCEEVTSYCLYDVFLLFTTSTSELYQKLYVFNLQINPEIYQEPSSTLLKKLEANSLNMRNVERGSKIIACSQGRCIFQLPRGNLEGIYPKIITLLNVKRAVNKMDYLKAFELVRTHKLDMNLLFDLNPEQFMTNGEKLLSDIKKVDYISLLIASLKEGVSDQLRYCLNKEESQKVEDYFQINKNKVKTVCELVSNSLRSLDYEKYILAIMAAQVKRGELPKVLHEIKSIKEKDVVVKIPPHMTQAPKQKKKMNSKEILQYVCWMADPETVYKVAFLTFDLELVAMAAEFTQKDPKQYLPYLQELKAIPNEIDRRAKICEDLKQYSEAIKELSKGNQDQKNKAVDLVDTHKLFKVGIESFRNQKQCLVKVRSLLGDYLISKDELAQAYNIYVSSGLFQKALQLSIKRSDTTNIIDLMSHLKYPQQKITTNVKQVIQRLAQNSAANHQSLGLAYQYLHQYEQASKIYLKSQNFARLNRILKFLSPEYIETKIIDSFKFLYSLKYNQTISEIKTFTEKYLRFQNVQKMKKLSVNLVIATKEADEMYSEYSRASGQTKSNYTVSTTTGMKKKKQKVKGILTRNVKEGSPLEEDYLIAVLNDLTTKSLDTIKTNKILIQQLIYVNLLSEAESLRDQTKIYSELVSKRIRPYKEIKYEEQNPDVTTIYPPYTPKPADTISSFDYII